MPFHSGSLTSQNGREHPRTHVNQSDDLCTDEVSISYVNSNTLRIIDIIQKLCLIIWDWYVVFLFGLIICQSLSSCLGPCNSNQFNSNHPRYFYTYFNTILIYLYNFFVLNVIKIFRNLTA